MTSEAETSPTIIRLEKIILAMERVIQLQEEMLAAIGAFSRIKPDGKVVAAVRIDQ